MCVRERKREKKLFWRVILFVFFYVFVSKCIFLTAREKVGNSCLTGTMSRGQSNNFQITDVKVKTG